MTKKILYIVLGIILVLAIAGGYAYPKYQVRVGTVTPGVNGGTQSSASVASQAFSAVSTSTVLSILQTDSTSRLIETSSAWAIAASGNGSTTDTFVVCATSTSPSSLFQSNGNANTNFVLNQDISAFGGAGEFGGGGYRITATSSAYMVSSSSPGIIGQSGSAAITGLATTTRIWNSGEYLVCQEGYANTGGFTPFIVDSTLQGYIRFAVSKQ